MPPGASSRPVRHGIAGPTPGTLINVTSPDPTSLPSSDDAIDSSIGRAAAPAADLRLAPTEREVAEARSRRRLMIAVRIAYLTGLVVFALLPFLPSLNPTFGEADGSFVIRTSFYGTLLFGLLILVVDALTPKKRLSTIFAFAFGIAAGFLASIALSALLNVIAEAWGLTEDPWSNYVLIVKMAGGVTLCYLAVSFVLTSKDDFRVVIPYVEFRRDVRGLRPLALDTSVLIDARVIALAESGFLDAPLVVPHFVIEELYRLGDSSDKLKRARGKRGLETLELLREVESATVTIDPSDGAGPVDQRLVEFAREQQLRVMTTDANLERLARIRDVVAINLNALANRIRPQVSPGDQFDLEITRRGQSDGQGVGFLGDGTMVVVENAAQHIGATLGIEVTNALQTSSGRMVFATLRAARETNGSVAESIADAATQQPRTPPPTRGGDDDAIGRFGSATRQRSPRNPRRSS